jgi:TRAP-type uncharacterized transport system fused permease subunit
MKTGWESMWVGSIIYFIPFFFVANPALVLQATDGGGVPYFEAIYLAVTALVGIAFICGGIQGYLTGIGDLRRVGFLEWPVRILLVLGGLTLATPGGGIMPLSNAQMEILAAALLVPTVLVALLMVRRSRTA